MPSADFNSLTRLQLSVGGAPRTKWDMDKRRSDGSSRERSTATKNATKVWNQVKFTFCLFFFCNYVLMYFLIIKEKHSKPCEENITHWIENLKFFEVQWCTIQILGSYEASYVVF